jgi:hypothetical protein
VDTHSSEHAIAHDLEALKMASRDVKGAVRPMAAEDRFEIESILHRMFEMASLNREAA